jgi:hypothetical protein
MLCLHGASGRRKLLRSTRLPKKLLRHRGGLHDKLSSRW